MKKEWILYPFRIRLIPVLQWEGFSLRTMASNSAERWKGISFKDRTKAGLESARAREKSEEGQKRINPLSKKH